MLVFTRHVLARMRQRGVTREQVEAAFANPARNRSGAAPGTFELEADLPAGLLLVVCAQPERARRVVITAYWLGRPGP